MALDMKPNFREKPNPYIRGYFESYELEETEITDNILHEWHGPEFEAYEKSIIWYLVGSLLILALVAYALYTNSPIMAITFILIGIVGFIHAQKNPRVIRFMITEDGIMADKELYLFENINSFWIFYEVHGIKTISLHTKANMLPFVHIPLGSQDPVRIREILIKKIPEVKQEHSLIDTIEQVLHI